MNQSTILIASEIYHWGFQIFDLPLITLELIVSVGVIHAN